MPQPTEWMQTYTGVEFPFMAPTQDCINITDIAHALAHQSRFAGHTTKFYSVAEHSVLVSRIVRPELAMCGLMHDASEAYLVDIPRPVKVHLKGYYEIEARIMRAISEKFEFPWPLHGEVKDIDGRILLDEREQLMKPTHHSHDEWCGFSEPIGVKIEAWDPRTAKIEFMKRFEELSR